MGTFCAHQQKRDSIQPFRPTQASRWSSLIEDVGWAIEGLARKSKEKLRRLGTGKGIFLRSKHQKTTDRRCEPSQLLIALTSATVG